MIVKYGDYSFANGECAMVNFSVKPKRTPRGIAYAQVVRMDCEGEFCFSGPVDQDAIKTKIQAARNALEFDYRDLVLLHNDGVTESPYKISNSHPDNITGNIVEFVSWPSVAPEEYATTKSFKFAVSAEFKNPLVNLIDWQQTLTVMGSTGPVARWERLLNGLWTRRVIHTSGTKKIIQSGYAVGFGVHPLPATPILTDFYEHLDQRVVKYVGPHYFASRPEFYRTEWRYAFETPFRYTPAFNYPVFK